MSTKVKTNHHKIIPWLPTNLRQQDELFLWQTTNKIKGVKDRHIDPGCIMYIRYSGTSQK
jgi:hypothetical protein